MKASVVVEQGIAGLLDRLPSQIAVVPRARSPWWVRTGQWAPLDRDETTQLVASLSPCTVLARPAEVDPGAACLPAIGRALGCEVVELPEDPAGAAWSVAISAQLDPEAPGSRRARDVICCGPDVVSRLAVGVGASVGDVPAFRAATLARWAECVWRACRWCAGGGAVGDVACRRCGLPVGGLRPAR